MRSSKRHNVFISGIILLSVCACRPVITIGWQEIAFVAVLLVLLLGPPIYRLIRRLAEFQDWRNSKGNGKKD
jgi:ABC-type transport system involved in cytochrome bd biosynthesis fused ATPase/permease subunit